jgi:hypothetical protein
VRAFRFRKIASSWWFTVLVAVFLALSVRSSVADFNDVPTGSMKPTILEGDRIYEKVREFISRFEEKNRSISCPDLLGCDISTLEGFEKAVRKNLMVTVCEELVIDAAKILEDMV